MSKPVLTISCLSSQESLQNVFRSMIRVFSQFTQSGLKHDWQYIEQQPVDVYILDLDDESNRHLLLSMTESTVIVISSRAVKLDGQKISLGKPLRSQSLLEALQHVERIINRVKPNGSTLEKNVSIAENTAATKTVGQQVGISIVGERHLPAEETEYQLHTWPDLEKVASDQILNVSRVCALLSIHPATAVFISRFFDLPVQEVEQLLLTIRQCAYPGHPVLQQGQHTVAHASRDNQVAVRPDERVESKHSSFLAKIWNRLKGAA